MKDYIFHPNLILRSPLLSIDFDISEERMGRELDRQEIEEAIYLSSPQLHSKIKKHFDPSSQEVEKDGKLLQTLRKYLMRMRTRCTPFGLYASCAVVQWGKESQLQTSTQDRSRRTRLDMQFLCELIQHICSQPSFQNHLRYHPNNSIYQSFDRYRFVEYYLKEGIRYHQLSSVQWSEYLDKLLQAAQNGCRLDELATVIVDEDISFEEARTFVQQLVGAQLLVSELDANVTGTPILDRVISFLSKQEGEETAEFSSTLQTIKQSLEQLDANQFNNTKAYSDIHENIRQLGISFEESRLIQTDSFRSIPKGVLTDQIQSSLRNVFPLLHKLSRFVEDNNIEVFKSAFREKYEGEEKPLAEVLDTERGIGYPVGGNANMSTPLIESIGSNFKDTMKIDWTAQEILLFSMAQEAMHSKSMEIDLAKYEKDILKLEANPFPSPASMSAIFKVVEDQNGQSRIHFKGAFGPSATTLIGRFADGHQPIQTIVNDIAKHEEVFYQQQQIELAEIAHLPESRTGNILFRPAFRKYEIPYLAGSTLEKDCQLDISDLMVSIKNDEVVIRSKKLNKRVLPRLGNAHNYEFRSLPIYQFLGDLQFQSINNGFYFEWGILKTEFTYLPRVTYQGVILARAQWNFSEREIKKLRANPAATLQAWKEQYQLPDLVVLLEGDNELLINVNDPLSVEILLMESKKSDFVTLLEFLFSTDNPLLKDQNGSTYTNEFIAFLLKKQSGETAPDFPQPQASQISICRTFPPGTEWVYFKLYCGYKTSDKVIAEYLLPFAEKMKAEEKIDKWFFIRYNDPRPHLRFRVLAKDRQLIGDIICRFYELLEPLSSHSVIHDIQLGTYTRELERYGGNLIELAESIFHADSKCIANFINLIEGDEGEKYRWFFALLSIDQLLEDFGIGLEDKLRLSESLKKGFAEEFKVNKNIKDQINDKYRTHRQEITQLFQPGSELREEMMPAIDLLEERGEEMAKYIAIYQQNKDQFDYRELLDSYIHMICNRLFISNQRKHELVIYDFLFKIYMSLKMRSLSKSKKLSIRKMKKEVS